MYFTEGNIDAFVEKINNHNLNKRKKSRKSHKPNLDNFDDEKSNFLLNNFFKKPNSILNNKEKDDWKNDIKQAKIQKIKDKNKKPALLNRLQTMFSKFLTFKR